MAMGSEIISLVDSLRITIEVITSIVDAIRAARNQGQDERDLELRFEADSVALRDLLAALQNAKAVSQTVSEEDEKLFSDIGSHLQSLTSCLKMRISKMRDLSGSVAAPAAPAPSNSVWTVTSRVSWALWRRRDLERLEESLYNWIGRLKVVYSAFRARGLDLVAGTAHLPGMDAVSRIGHKIDDYGRLAAREVDESTLLKPMDSIKLLGSRSRRNPAHYDPDGQTLPPQPVVFEYTAQSYTESSSKADVAHIGNATRDLAKVLFHSDPDRTGLLRCVGYAHDEARRSFGLLYELPPSARGASAAATWRIHSLRDLFEHEKRPAFSLTDRVTLCCDVAKAVLYVHLLGWVHKSVRPDNILLFSAAAAATDSGSGSGSGGRDRPPWPGNGSGKKRSPPPCYLAGFEYARSAQAASDRRSNGDWQHNVYRHSRRQGVAGNSEYTMAHDIYSFGVVCLEIGKWGRDPVTRVPYGDRSRFEELGPDDVRDVLVRILDGSSGGLAASMGDKFSEIVRYCLTIGAGDDVPSARYIQEV